MLPPLVVIAGTTASGKSRLSLELADAIGGAEIISADSRQVYRGMDIGTAKVAAADRERVPHHGLDLVDPDQPFTAAMFHGHAFEALKGLAARDGVALLVGGTGLYLRAVARNVPLDETGHDPQLRVELEARLETEGLGPLAADLRAVAPTTAAMIDLANPRRVIRALERASLHGDNAPPAPRGYPASVLWLGVDLPRAEHDRAIRDRAAWQFEHGLLEEAQGLLARYPEDLRSFSAVGYPEAFDVLAGRRSREEAVARVVLRTRQFARRQRTWFRAEPELVWLDPGAVDLPRLVDRVQAMRTDVAAT
jgi:tRNA dimethylallyltransferase